MLLSRVLAAAPGTRGTLFDQPEVAKQAKAAFADAAIRSRCEVIGGDFLALAPKGGDLYLLKPGIANPGKVMDVIMLMLLEGGRERTAEQHRALFERVGIRFEREITTPGPITLFEACGPEARDMRSAQN